MKIKTILLIFFATYWFINFLAFGAGMIQVRNCPAWYYGTRVCKPDDEPYIIMHTRWKYVFTGYNAGVKFGFWMAERDDA